MTELEEFTANYFGLETDNVSENDKINADFGQIVNLLAMYEEKLNLL